MARLSENLLLSRSRARTLWSSVLLWCWRVILMVDDFVFGFGSVWNGIGTTADRKQMASERRQDCTGHVTVTHKNHHLIR